MTHVKNFLSVAALVAVVSFSSFGMSAKSVNSAIDSSLEKENMVENMSQADKLVEQKTPFIFNMDYLNHVVSFMNIFTPCAIDEDFKLVSVTMENDEIDINTSCDYETALAVLKIEEEMSDELKYLLAAGVYDAFNEVGVDDNGDNLVTKMQEYEIKVNYNLYIEGIEVPFKTFTFTSTFIERAGLINSNVYSI